VSRPVSSAARLRDGAAMLLLLGGAGTWLYGYLGLYDIRTRPIALSPGETAVGRAVHFWYFTRAGAAIVVAGIIAMAWAFWMHRREKPSIDQ
jgi:hypothetical protein